MLLIVLGETLYVHRLVVRGEDYTALILDRISFWSISFGFYPIIIISMFLVGVGDPSGAIITFVVGFIGIGIISVVVLYELPRRQKKRMVDRVLELKKSDPSEKNLYTERAKGVIDTFDLDNDGYLDRGELRKFILYARPDLRGKDQARIVDLFSPYMDSFDGEMGIGYCLRAHRVSTLAFPRHSARPIWLQKVQHSKMGALIICTAGKDQFAIACSELHDELQDPPDMMRRGSKLVQPKPPKPNLSTSILSRLSSRGGMVSPACESGGGQPLVGHPHAAPKVRQRSWSKPFRAAPARPSAVTQNHVQPPPPPPPPPAPAAPEKNGIPPAPY